MPNLRLRTFNFAVATVQRRSVEAPEPVYGPTFGGFRLSIEDADFEPYARSGGFRYGNGVIRVPAGRNENSRRHCCLGRLQSRLISMKFIQKSTRSQLLSCTECSN